MRESLAAAGRRQLLAGTWHPEPFVRSESARLLGELGDPVAVPALTAMLKTDRWYSKITAVYALARIGDRRAIPVLRSTARDPRVFDFSGMYNHDMIRLAAVLALLSWNDPSGMVRIPDLLGTRTSDAYLHLAPAIRVLPDSPAARRLKGRVSSGYLRRSADRTRDSAIHLRVVQALAYCRGRPALEWVERALDHASPYVRAGAADTLLRSWDTPDHRALVARALARERAPFAKVRFALVLWHRDRRADRLPVLLESLRHRDAFVRATGVDALAETGRSDLATEILPCLEDANFYVRLCAVDALEKLGTTAARPRVRRMLRDPDLRVRLQAAKYLAAPTPDIASPVGR